MYNGGERRGGVQDAVWVDGCWFCETVKGGGRGEDIRGRYIIRKKKGRREEANECEHCFEI